MSCALRWGVRGVQLVGLGGACGLQRHIIWGNFGLHAEVMGHVAAASILRMVKEKEARRYYGTAISEIGRVTSTFANQVWRTS
jgi:hypothetical protein